MKRMLGYVSVFMVALAGLGFFGLMGSAAAATRTFNLQATSGYISTPDGGQIYMWGFADQAGGFRYPGPVIDVNEGDQVVVNLTNNLPDPDGAGPLRAEPVSMLFFGQDGVSNEIPQYETVGQKGSLRSLAAEALPGGSVTYTFTASKPGTYYYQSGTNIHKQINMGLIGGLIIRPATANQAYETSDSTYDREFLLLLSAVDYYQHRRVENGLEYQASSYLPTYWFINGRAFPDTILPDNLSYLPAQPMSSMVFMYPGERLLFRMVTLDSDMHPFHHHGNHANVIAENGRLLRSSSAETISDLARERFTQSIWSGQTVDAIYTWEGTDLGWDIYGHTGADPLKPLESVLGHDEPFPVINPLDHDETDTSPVMGIGELYSGSPFLGKMGVFPSDHTSFNQVGEHYMMFHSHHEVEIQNFDEGPGGMMTHIMILPR